MCIVEDGVMYRILIVEDDEVIAGAIEREIKSWGYEAKQAEDFEHVLKEFTEFHPQLVLLDIGLPFYNGFYWCSEIRKLSSVPIIFISSAADSMNIVMAMNMGGDDFLVKPFDLKVMTAKVQALLRRTYDFAGQSELLEHRGLILNSSDGSFTYQGVRTDLTKNENRILQTLMEQKGKIVSRETLMKRLWETDSFVDENTLNVNITRLRRKIAQAGIPDFVSTRKGEGYLLEEQP